MTDTIPAHSVEHLHDTPTSPGDGEPFVPLSDPTRDRVVIDWLNGYAGPSAVESPLFSQAVEYWRCLIRREIFCHTPDIAVARAFLARLPDDIAAGFEFVWNEGGTVARV